MRVDRYLWSVRIFKSRSIAADACKSNKVKRGGDFLKPAKEIRIGEEISVKKGPLNLSFKVKEFPKSRVGAKLVADYVINTTPEEEFERVKRERESFYYHNKFKEGRPTKRDRRELDDVLNQPAPESSETHWEDFFSDENEFDWEE